MDKNLYAVEFVNLTKKFNEIVANNNINLKIKKGSIFALIGENGAGKSTLMSVLFGLYNPTLGHIKINGIKTEIKNPNHANVLRIGMVHQHFKLVGNYTNLENVILGQEFVKKNLLYYQPAIEKIKLLQKKYKLEFNLNQKTQNASISSQQKVEIMKMLYRDADILIFDEPTAVLNPQEIDGLLATMLEFKKDNKTIIFISHKLNELKQVADAGAVLRMGKVILEISNFKQIELKTISKAMVGSDVNIVKNQNKNKNFNQVGLMFENVCASHYNSLKNVNFIINQGEIFAIAGIESNGQDEIEFVLSGIIKLKKGSIKFYDPITNQLIDVSKKSIQKRQKLGLSYIPSDRQKYGLVLDFTIFNNSIIRRMADHQIKRFGFIKTKFVRKFYDHITTKFDVRGTQNGIAWARSLSGGNQQKAIVGRELLTSHNILIVSQPTRGLDVGAIQNIHKAILVEKAKAKAILLISYELDEVFALADSVAVINKGVLSPKVSINKIDRVTIGLMMGGLDYKNAVNDNKIKD